MHTLSNALSPWHEFFALLGTASATMVGLLFVAASVGTGVFSADRRAAMRVFLSASVINFSLVLAACLVVLVPLKDWEAIGAMIFASALFGLAHSCMACRDTLRDGLIAKLDMEDRIWYIALPILGYMCMGASGVTFAVHYDLACPALAVSAGLLTAVGIHNAWDITLWSMTRRRD